MKERILSDPDYLKNYDVIMLDEIHERGVNMDILIGLLAYHLSQRKYPNLKVILSSATMD